MGANLSCKVGAYMSLVLGVVTYTRQQQIKGERMLIGAIVMTAGGVLLSDLVDALAAPSVYEGLRVQISANLDLLPYAVVLCGATGSVVFVDQDSGEVEILLDVPVPGLAAWGNSFSLLPFETEAALAAVRCMPSVKISSRVPVQYPYKEVHA